MYLWPPPPPRPPRGMLSKANSFFQIVHETLSQINTQYFLEGYLKNELLFLTTFVQINFLEGKFFFNYMFLLMQFQVQNNIYTSIIIYFKSISKSTFDKNPMSRDQFHTVLICTALPFVTLPPFSFWSPLFFVKMELTKFILILVLIRFKKESFL